MTALRKHKAQLDRRASARPLALLAVGSRLSRIGPSMHYIIKGRRFKPVPFWKYIMWTKTELRGRATKQIARSKAGDYCVSTIFLGLDHSFMEGYPILFETMAYRRKDDGTGEFRDEQYRYRTWEEAIKGHRQLANRLGNIRLIHSTT